MDRRQTLAGGQTLPDRTHGSALFADISGFTSLTEALSRSLGPRQGMDALLMQLNSAYEALASEVNRYGGSVISFSGDAITCWFDENLPFGQRTLPAPQRAAACALGMQSQMRRFRRLALPDGTATSLALKVAIASGPARRFAVGDPAIQIFDTLAGETVQRMDEAEHLAASDQVLVDENTLERLPLFPQPAEWLQNSETGRRFAVLPTLETPLLAALQDCACPWPEVPAPLPDDALRPWLLPAVYTRHKAGLGEFITELRPAVALFLRFVGIDYEESEGGDKLDALIRQIQNILVRYEGALLQLTIGDKGSYLYAAFGAPVAHENDAERAIWAALEMFSIPKTLVYLQPFQAGISLGLMRAGAYGSSQRRVYGVLGDEVNLAARLMEHAQPGQILASSRVRETANGPFCFEPLPPIPLKGKTELLPTFAVSREKEVQPLRLIEPAYTLPMIGRSAELALVNEKISLALQGQGQVIGITGEAGIGKSRLVAEIGRLARRRGLQGFGGECPSYGLNTPYLVWGPIWRSFFNLDPAMPLRRQLRTLEAAVKDLAPERWQALPLLGKMLNLPIPENDFTCLLEPEHRKTALEALLLDCLVSAAGEAGESGSGLLLVFEDLHWIDPASHDLLTLAAQAIANLPVLIVGAYRPPELPRLRPPRVSALPHFTLITLHELSPEEARQLVQIRLAQFAPEIAASMPEALVRHLLERAQGNPFYLEELLNFLRDRGVDPRQPEALQSLELPPSLQRLILARIDQLSEAQKITIKVASVIGRLFRYAWLHGYYPELGDEKELKANLNRLAMLDLTPLDTPEPELAYLFKHILTREVAYESLASATRARLHGQLAAWLEANLGENLERSLDLLAYHYDLSDNLPKRRLYLRRAGEAAASRFANAEAIEYFERALTLAAPEDLEERFALHLARERVYDLQGERALQRQDIQALEALAEEAGRADWRAQAALRHSSFALLTGDQPTAIEAAQKAIVWAQSAALPRLEAIGYRCLALALAEPGEYARALECYERSLGIFRHLDDRQEEARTLSGIGLLAYSKGNYAEAEVYQRQSLEIARQIGDKVQQGSALRHLGVLARSQGKYAAARAFYEESLGIARAIGDRRQEGSALNNLGIVALALGDYKAARAYYEQSLEISRATANLRMQSNTLNNLGLIALDTGDYHAARQFFEQSLTIDRQTHNRRGESITLGNLGDVARALGDYAQARAYYEQTLATARALGNKEDEGWALSALGGAALGLGYFEISRVYFEQSLEIVRQTGDRLWEGSALLGLGHACLGAEKPTEAAAYYEQSLTIWKALGVAHFAVEARAGLALSALAQGQKETALACAEEILGYLQSGSLDGMKDPLRVYLACYQALQANADRRAEQVLQQAQAELQKRAARLPDLASQRSYLENVPENRLLRQAWENRSADSPVAAP